MPAESEQPDFSTLAGRTFSFYPAIRNLEHNEWTFERRTWSEVLVRNLSSREEIWIPRNYLGEVSSSDSPVLIVGLHRELELKAGAVWPFKKRVIEMPRPRSGEVSPTASGSGEASAGTDSPATESRLSRFVGGAIAAGVGLCLLLVIFVSEGMPDPAAWFAQVSIETSDQRYLGLGGEDGYHDIVIRVGRPDAERWITPEAGQLQFQLLSYRSRSYAVVLMGPERGGARYVGTIHLPSRRLLDSVPLSGGGSTASMMRNLPEF